MKKLIGLLVTAGFLSIGVNVATAQEATSDAMAPPKVLIIQREYVKPGKAGLAHQKTESAFVQAMAAAKWPTHYFAMESLSGRPRALFLIGYPSFEAWEKDNLATEKNATLSAALDRASVADGDLLTEYGSSAFMFRPDLSLRAGSINIAQMRYFEISQIRVKPGHERDWDELAKMYVNGFEKASPESHAVIFESMYGQDNGGVFLVFTPMKTLAEVDREADDFNKFMGVLGVNGMKRLSELSVACLESTQTNLFHFSPKMSYPMDEWVKADPDFWKPKMAAPAKKAASTTTP